MFVSYKLRAENLNKKSHATSTKYEPEQPENNLDDIGLVLIKFFKECEKLLMIHFLCWVVINAKFTFCKFL